MLRFYNPVNPMGSGQAWSDYLTTLLLGRLSPLKRLTNIVHILLPETDNCPTWISGRERMTVENHIIIDNQSSLKNVADTAGLGGGGRWTCNLLITSGTNIQLSNQGRLLWHYLIHSIIVTAFDKDSFLRLWPMHMYCHGKIRKQNRFSFLSKICCRYSLKLVHNVYVYQQSIFLLLIKQQNYPRIKILSS